MKESATLDEVELRAAVVAAARSSITGDVLIADDGLCRLPGGASGLTYRADLCGGGAVRDIVIKVAPPGVPPVRNRDVLRQAALLRTLAAQDFPVPRVLFCAKGSGSLPPFYATEFVKGTAYEPIFDGPGWCSDTEIRARVGGAIALLARLHDLDVADLPVDAGPPMTLGDEVARWTRAFESVPAPLRSEGIQLGAALASCVPDALPPVLVHGDFRLGNMIAEGEVIKAVLDWEICSVSDPRIDLSWFIAQADASSHPLAVWQPPAMPSAQALVELYARHRGVTITDMGWFQALVRFKVAATSALIAKHSRTQAGPELRVSKWEPAIPTLVADGLRIIKEAR